MTITHLDDEPLDTLHPLDLLERAVEANGWAFERAGRDELNLSVAGKWSDHHFNFSWRDDLQSRVGHRSMMRPPSAIIVWPVT